MYTLSVIERCEGVLKSSVVDEPFFGVDYRINRIKPGMFFIIMDDSWHDRSKIKHRQYGKSISELVAQAKSFGIDKFVVGVGDFDESVFSDVQFVKVKNTTDFLYQIASACKESHPVFKIAVTGSAGKSTTKDMIDLLLSTEKESGELFVGRASENISATILTQFTKFNGFSLALLEVAGSCFKHFKSPGFEVAPDVAIVTSISEGHLESLGTLKGVAEHKSKIFSGMKQSGYALINLDTPFSDLLVDTAKLSGASVVGYGSSPDADIQLLDYDYSNGLVTVNFSDEIVSYKLAARGKHMALNSIAAAAAVKLSGCKDWKSRLLCFEGFSALSGRGEVLELTVKEKKITLIDETYNANPTSMESALQLLSHMSPRNQGRRIAVLGDMMELGGEAESLHAKLLDSVLSSKADKVYLVGDFMQHLWIKLPKNVKGALLPTVDGLYRFLTPTLKDGDVVLFKSSNSTRLNVVVKKLKQAGL